MGQLSMLGKFLLLLLLRWLLASEGTLIKTLVRRRSVRRLTLLLLLLLLHKRLPTRMSMVEALVLCWTVGKLGILLLTLLLMLLLMLRLWSRFTWSVWWIEDARRQRTMEVSPLRPQDSDNLSKSAMWSSWFKEMLAEATVIALLLLFRQFTSCRYRDLTYPITSELPVTIVVGVVSDAAVYLALVEDYLAGACCIEDLEGM